MKPLQEVTLLALANDGMELVVGSKERKLVDVANPKFVIHVNTLTDDEVAELIDADYIRLSTLTQIPLDLTTSHFQITANGKEFVGEKYGHTA